MKLLYECRIDGNTRYFSEDQNPRGYICEICHQGSTYQKVSFTNEYDKPHQLDIWVPAHSLERVAGAPDNKRLFRNLLTSAITWESEDHLRDLAASLETRLNEFAVERMKVE